MAVASAGPHANKSALHSRQIATPVSHHSVLQAGCPSCRPTNSVKALKAVTHKNNRAKNMKAVATKEKEKAECELRTALSRPKRTSVCMVRSWASSNMMMEYCVRSGSIRHSRSSMPSVMYLMTVSELVQSSNRIV